MGQLVNYIQNVKPQMHTAK